MKMNRNSVCMLCYQRLEDLESTNHSTCSKKFFGKTKPPLLPYKLDELDELAKNIVQSSVTVPGVQAKLSLHLAERGKESGRLTLVGLWGNYILKPPVQSYPQMPEIEDLTMHLARFFKIETVPHGLIPLKSGELAYITRRIDRDKSGKKRHLEDMCQLTERLTEDKYKGSMEQVAKVILKFSSNPLLDVIHFFEVTLFSFLTGNADMHLKNFSLLHEPGQYIRLSPAYDMLSTRLLISERDDPEEMALTLNGKKSNFMLKDYSQFAKTIGLTDKQFEKSLARFQTGYSSAKAFIYKSFLSLEKKQEFTELMKIRASTLGFEE